ncbi:hypothetical protein ACU6U9_23270 [Pseudomonas sp. HK3]
MKPLIYMSLMFVVTACGGGGSNSVPPVQLEKQIPNISFLIIENLQGDDSSRYAFEGTTLIVRHSFVDNDMHMIDASRSYWLSQDDQEIQEGANIDLLNTHIGFIKACVAPALTDGRKGSAFCSEPIVIKAIPTLASKIISLDAFDKGDYFESAIQWSSMPDINTWEVRWFDDNDIYHSTADQFQFQNSNLDKVKFCVYELVTKQCVKYSSTVVVPNAKVPDVSILGLTGIFSLDGEIRPNVRSSYNYTRHVSSEYKWFLNNVEISTNEKLILLKDYFSENIKICVTQNYANFKDSNSTPSEEVCFETVINEQANPVTTIFDIIDNLYAEGAPWVFSGKFRSAEKVDFSTMRIIYQDMLLTEDVDFDLVTQNDADNNFSIRIPQQTGGIVKIGCTFSYLGKLVDCFGAENTNGTEISIHHNSKLRDSVSGKVEQNNRLIFETCKIGDEITWSLDGVSQPIIFITDRICYGPTGDADIYLTSDMVGKDISIEVKRRPDPSMTDDQIQIIELDLGVIN